MKTYLKWMMSIVLLTILSSCFKDEPKKEMRKAAGSWRVEKVTIHTNDSLGNEITSTEILEVGMLLLTHDDEFLFEGTFSYSLDGTALAGSSMYYLFSQSDVWGIGIDGKTFNIGNNDGSTGYTTHVAGFTVLKLTRKKMEFQYVHVHPVTGNLDYMEEWVLKRGTH